MFSSWMSAELPIRTACGIGSNPSASRSRPVSTASTPGAAFAASVSIERINACA